MTEEQKKHDQKRKEAKVMFLNNLFTNPAVALYMRLKGYMLHYVDMGFPIYYENANLEIYFQGVIDELCHDLVYFDSSKWRLVIILSLVFLVIVSYSHPYIALICYVTLFVLSLYTFSRMAAPVWALINSFPLPEIRHIIDNAETNKKEAEFEILADVVKEIAAVEVA